MTARVEFISLELQDVGPFGGRQFFSFARPRAGWGPGLTVVTGGGGSGKSSLAAALQLAIWGTSWPDASGRDYHSRWLAADWRRCINVQALRHPDPTALLRLTLRTSAAEGAGARTIISRSISVRDDQSVLDSVRVEVAERGEQPREAPGDHMGVIEELLPRDCLGLMFCNGERLEDLGGLASRDPLRRARALNEAQALTGSRSLEVWRDAGPIIIEVGQRMLDGPEGGDLGLGPGPGDTLPPPDMIVPGVPMGRGPAHQWTLEYIGAALVLALRASRGLHVPLVLDAPLNGLPIGEAVLCLEALSRVAPSQLVLLAHDEQIDALALALWGRAERTYLVECHRAGRTALLSDP